MLHYWLQSALAASGVNQSDLARKLTEALGRTIDRSAVNKMTSGERRILADELLETSRICDFPLPLSARTKSSSEYEKALAAILPTLNDEPLPLPVDPSQFNDEDDIVQISFKDLSQCIAEALSEDLNISIENVSEKIVIRIKVAIGRRQVFIVESI